MRLCCMLKMMRGGCREKARYTYTVRHGTNQLSQAPWWVRDPKFGLRDHVRPEYGETFVILDSMVVWLMRHAD